MILIPEQITAGFKEQDANKKLAFLVYTNEKKELSQPKAWEKWRDKKIEPLNFNNEPTSGFVIDKTVGGYRTRFAYRGESVRVYDQRGFEIEITVNNLLNILRMYDCKAGGEIQGEFVYAWDGFQLILMPTIAEDYKEIKEFTELKLQNKKFKKADLVENTVYRTKKNELVLFLCDRLAVNDKNGVGTFKVFYWLSDNEISSISTEHLINEERKATQAELDKAKLYLAQSKYKENVNKKSKKIVQIKLNWFTGRNFCFEANGEELKGNFYLDFQKNEVFFNYKEKLTIKEFIGFKKPELVLYSYDSGEIYFGDLKNIFFNTKNIEKWCKENAL